jgi:hypothetical protein
MAFPDKTDSGVFTSQFGDTRYEVNSADNIVEFR